MDAVICMRQHTNMAPRACSSACVAFRLISTTFVTDFHQAEHTLVAHTGLLLGEVVRLPLRGAEKAGNHFAQNLTIAFPSHPFHQDCEQEIYQQCGQV